MMYVDVVLSEGILHAYFIQKKSASESASGVSHRLAPLLDFKGS